MKHRYYIIFIFFTVFTLNAFSQPDCITDPPLAPVLQSVSIQPETGYTELTWTLSPSSGIAAYIIYSYRNGDGTPIDTVWDPSATRLTLQSSASKYFSVSYVVAAMRLPRCTSIFSNIINSIFENAAIDTCTKKIVVTWNSYTPVPVPVTGYSVLLAVNGGPFSVASELNPGANSFTLNDFAIDAQYCFVIRANLANATFSTSNKTCILTKMQRPPDWINADQASVTADGNVDVSFTIDPLSELKHFSLSKKTGNGIFREIARPVSATGTVRYTDTNAATDSINFYRLSAVNSCDLPVAVSNVASNIVLATEISGQDIILSWNSYKSWLGNISGYRLYVNTGSGYQERAFISSSDTVYRQDYKEIMYEVTADKVCFYVTATEDSNPHGIAGLSVSSEVCLAPVENITVPNVFTPNNDLNNDLFKPVLSFTPRDYHLIISDRHGVVLFETRDFLEEWDGTKNGTPRNEGVCLWFLKVTTPSGKSISKTGTVTIIK